MAERGYLVLEIRIVQFNDGSSQLQQRTRLPQVGASGAFCGFSEWSDWAAVEIVIGDQHARPVVEVFDTRK